MRGLALLALAAAPLWCGPVRPAAASGGGQMDEKKIDKADEKAAAKGPALLTPAAQATLTKALKVKVTASITDARLGDVLKKFAALADAKADALILWTYGPDFPYAQKITYACKDKPIDAALDEIFKKAGKLGYVVVSKDGDRHDGWVLLTTAGERGFVPGAEAVPKATAAEEAEAAEKLGVAKKQLDGGNADRAKLILRDVVKSYPGATAAAEARELLAKLEQ
jgi:hypothetical protein